MNAENVRYGIAVQGSWYYGHGGISGCGCFRTTSGLFPQWFYETAMDAEKAMRAIGKDFPEHFPNSRIVKIEFNFR